MVAGLKVRLEEPVFCNVAVREVLVDTGTAPNPKGDGVRLTIGTPAEEDT